MPDVAEKKSRPRARRSIPPPRGTSLQSGTWQLVYQGLRARIVSMEMRPGEQISDSDLARRFGVSRTPVREAIQRLASEGLVEIFPQSGTFVARIPYEDLPEAM